jgi:hypothetical protein
MPRLNSKAAAGRAFLDELLSESKGRKKNCKIGKSCGSSCVSPTKDCELPLKGKRSKSLTKVAGEVERKKRARCEENWAELIVAAVLENPGSSSLQDILTSRVAKTEPAYVKDLEKRKPDKVDAYIKNFKEELSKLNITPEKVFLLGKDQNKYPEIEKLQQGLDRKEKKADVIVKTTDGKYIGFSVKASSGATLTNYAIEKLLPDYADRLKQVRLKMVKDAGLPDTFDKALRGEYNNLFRGGRNPYHDLLRDSVMENKQEILKQWSKGLFSKTPFPIYSFDGNKIRANDESSLKNVKFDIKPIENPNPNSRGAAKTYFLVTENGKPSYIWDVRWKGSPAFGSPQIQTMRVHEEKKKIFKSFAPG